MAEALAKKKNTRKVLKNIIATTPQEAQVYLSEDATNTNETIEILLSYQDKLKSKTNAFKTLEKDSLYLLGIKKSTSGTLITTLILKNFPQEIKLIVTRNIKGTWDLTKIFEIVNLRFVKLAH